MTAVLPQIGTGNFLGEKENHMSSHNDVSMTSRMARGRPTLLELSQNYEAIKQEHIEEKIKRSRSHDAGAKSREFDNRKRKSKQDRSKSLGHGDPKRSKQKRKYVFDMNANIVDVNSNADDRNQKDNNTVSSSNNINQNNQLDQSTSTDKRVRFDSSSDDSYEQQNRHKDYKTSDQFSRQTGVQFKMTNNERNGVRMGANSPVYIYKNSPKQPRRLETLDSPKRRTRAVSPKKGRGNYTSDKKTVNAQSVKNKLDEPENVHIGSASSPQPKSSRTSPYGSPLGGKRPAPGTHQARLEAARARARLWADTYSDPGPAPNEKVLKSIDNDKVIRGRPVDRHHNRLGPASTGYPAQRHDRPKGADRGNRPPRSLPAAKESHASEVKERPAISAPSKEQQQQHQQQAPAPKVNTLVSKDSSPSKPATSHTSTSSPTKSQPPEKDSPSAAPSVPTPKPTTSTSSVTPTKSKTSVETAVQSPDKNTPTSTEKHTTPVSDKHKSPDRKPAESSPSKSTPVPVKQQRKADKPPSNSPGLMGAKQSTEQEKEKSKETKSKLPPDDHGPVEPPRVQINKSESKGRNSEELAKQKEDEKRRKEREADFKREIEKQLDDASTVTKRQQSEKSAKTDKSWSTIKTGKTDSKASSITPTKSKTSYDMTQSPSTELVERSKRREVTIVDPKTMDRYKSIINSEEAEAMVHEYEYAHGHLHHKDFAEMTEEEKVVYFRDFMKIKPDQIREMTFHPKITEKKSIHRAYTGIGAGNWNLIRLRSGKRPKSRKVSVYKKVQTLAPHQRKQFIHSRLQGSVYRHINTVYGNSPREDREKRFFEKLSKLQMNEMQSRYDQLAERERRKFEAKLRQRDQLKRLRRRFEDDAWRRFMTQYVTSKVVEAEYKDRKEYGLPNDIRPERPRAYYPRGGRERGHYSMTPRTRQKSNFKKYQNMFRFNIGPEMKERGKPMKFEGFDTVYLDTEDENGKPKRKKQNVEDLMREAQRILDQSDNDDTDLEDSPRHEAQRRSYRSHHRPQHRRHVTRDVRDDKSGVTSSTRTATTMKTGTTIKTKYTNRNPPPKNMREMLERRLPQANRYKASGFDTMKEDLLKDSEQLNKNENLLKVTDAANESKPDKEKSVSSTDRNMRTPPENVPTKHHSPVRKPAPTKNAANSKTDTGAKKKDPETVSVASHWTPKPDQHLEGPVTQMGLETARDKIKQDPPSKLPSRSPSRISKVSNKPESKPETGSQWKHFNKPGENKNANRTPSRVSARSQQVDNSKNKDLPPVRAPSRNSLVSKDSKGTVDSMPSVPQRKISKASVVPPIAETPTPEANIGDSQMTNGDLSPVEKRQSSLFLTEPEGEGEEDEKTVTSQDAEVQKPSPAKPDSEQNGSRRPSDVSYNKPQYRKPSKILISSNHTSQASLQEPKNQANGRASVNNFSKKSDSPTRSVDPKQINGHVSPERPAKTDRKPSVSVNDKQKNHVNTENGKPKETKKNEDKPRTVVTKTVNVQDSSQSSKKSETAKPVMKPKKAPQKEERKVNMDNSDIFSTQKASYHDREKEKPAPKGKAKPKPKTKKSRSRTPVRSKPLVNGHDPATDTVVTMNEYEKTRKSRSVSRDASPRGRKRSTSRGRGKRKRSTSGGRKSRGERRSVSKERKSPGKSRFPDIRKDKDGQWEISPVHDKPAPTPPPKTDNQWKSLVEKYIRQPSPKIGKSDDRSLLDSGPDDDDDDDMDIFKRASKRYNLSMSGKGDDDDDDDSDY